MHRGLGQTGVVGIVHGRDGGACGRAVGLRADMDALPIHEANTFAHASRHPGRMHACGHDGHTAMLLARPTTSRGTATSTARCTAFDGPVVPGAEYVLVDDFVGMGGTLANLRGYLLAGGGKVLAAVALTGKGYSARLALTARTLDQLRNSHGADLEKWWQGRFAHAFDALTESEARYLARTADADTVRNRIVAAEQA